LVSFCETEIAGATCIATEEGIGAESATLAVVIGSKNYKYVFDSHHHEKTPKNDRQDSQQVCPGGRGGKCRREDVERTGADIPINNTHRLI
jgi:hypothetical protein